MKYNTTVTGWYSEKTKPVRDGLYECETQTEAWPFPQIKKLEWHSDRWWDEESSMVESSNIKQWRGLANNPDAAA